MSEKLDYYKVLGVEKTATAAEIKKAHTKLSFKYHPDRNRQKPEAEQEAAEEKFKEITEAIGVLGNEDKRGIYDRLGHAGLEGHAAGDSNDGGTKPYRTTVRERKMATEEELFDFFGKSKAKRDGDPGPVQTDTPAVSADDAAAARRARRRAYREGNVPADKLAPRTTTPPASTRPTRRPDAAPVAKPPASPAPDFDSAADDMGRVTEALRDGVEVPVDALVAFRAALAEMAGEVDKAIARGKGGPAPKP